MITKREVGTLVLHLGYRKVERGYFYYYHYKYKKQWDLQLTIFLEISDSWGLRAHSVNYTERLVPPKRDGSQAPAYVGQMLDSNILWEDFS